MPYGNRYRPSYMSRYNRRRRRRRLRRNRYRYSNYYYYRYGPRPRNRPNRADSSDEEAPNEELVKALHVKSLDLQVRKNTSEHNTEKYDVDKDELVVRRGQEFSFICKWDRRYAEKNDDVELLFQAGGDDDSPRSKTTVKLTLDESGAKNSNKSKWHARLTKGKESEKTEITVYTPSDCPIGEWTMKISTISVGTDGKTRHFTYTNSLEIKVLFNAWCEDDQCYYRPTRDLIEYVLNKEGCVYRGNSTKMFAKAWDFGQFEKGILDICFRLLEFGFGGDKDAKYSDPVKVTRVVAKMVNSAEDNGILSGNWSGDYSGGTRPSVWSKSATILKKWRDSGYKPVKWAQCWVFSAVTVSVCRALGIPCRSVTNFSSAHDTDGNTMIDKSCDENGRSLPSSDSIWNFHVWNECCFKRPDLPDGYDGWQVIDATPQELSEGDYTCGPCPVVAIKEGQCIIPYDATFIFAEVNAHVATWVKKSPYDYVFLKMETDRVGKKISTKYPDGKRYRGQRWREWEDKYHRLDLTECYKHKEGSDEEHRASMRARREKEFPDCVQDLEMVMEETDSIMVGDDVQFVMRVQNVSKEKETRHISSMTVCISSELYTGQQQNLIKEEHIEPFALDYMEVRNILVNLPDEEYEDLLSDGSLLSIVVCADCYESEIPSMLDDHFRFFRPDIAIEMQDTAKIGEKVTLKLYFKNPLRKRSLTDCMLYIEVSDADDQELIQNNVPPGEMWTGAADFKPERAGEIQVTTVFKCEELDDITETVWLQVKD